MTIGKKDMSSSYTILSHHWVDIVYRLHNENVYYHTIEKDDLAEAINNIYHNEYNLSPLLRIYFTPGRIVGSDNTYKGVPVLPISEKPPVDLGISFECTTFYMRPLDELVLSSLGNLLLQIHYPYYFEDKENYVSYRSKLPWSVIKGISLEMYRPKVFVRIVFEDRRCSQYM